MKNQACIIDSEFSVSHCQNGLQLVNSNNFDDSNKSFLISNMLALPFNVYFFDTENVFIQSNDFNAQSCSFDSPYNAIGKSIFKISTKTYSNKLARNNQNVLSSKNKFFFEEEIVTSEGVLFQGLTVKMPLFVDSEIKGLFGCTIVLGRDNLFHSLNQLMNLGLLSLNENKYFLKSEESGIHLTNREKECLHLTLHGKNAREISLILGLGKRTVEFYLANIKSKFMVTKKSDLIEKAIRYFK